MTVANAKFYGTGRRKKSIARVYLVPGTGKITINKRDINSMSEQSDGYQIRRCAVENNVTMFTALDTVKVLLDVLEEMTITISTIDKE